MSVDPLQLVSSHPWQRAAFTTYALSLSFFEAVILEALLRGGANTQAVILADVLGVRESLSEQGAHRVGRDYEVEPVAVTGGVFHPKIGVLASADECHLLVGSGNLTFNGWGGNCEQLEHLHPAFAPDAIADSADFFELLSVTDRIRFGAGEHCAATAAVLRRAVQGRTGDGTIRLLHSLDRSIAEQVAQVAADMGGAQRLVVAAPFWDSGAALDNLCRALGLQEVLVHAHSKGCVEGTVGANWPRNTAVPVRAVRVAAMDGPAEAKRPLHAKAFEILCRRGRVLVSGSANGTRAALGSNANVEACVMRVQRERSVGWTVAQAEAPDPQGTADGAGDESELVRAGVLRAVLESDDVVGQVLTPSMSGAVQVYHMAAIGPELLAETELDDTASFKFAAPDLEKSSWRGGRLVIRVADARGRIAEGFASIASFAEVTRRGGIVTRRLFSIIFGNETPEDVTAVLSWFLEDPRRLSSDHQEIRSGGDSKGLDDSDRLIPISALHPELTGSIAGATPAAAGERHWSRFLDSVLAAFRESRGPFAGTGSGATGEEEGDDTPLEGPKPGAKDRAIDKAYGSFRQLFGVLTKDGSPPRNCEVAFDLTGFICARLRPDLQEVRAWLERVIRVWLAAGVRAERRDDLASAVLTVLGTAPDAGRCRWARACLLRLGLDFSTPPPPGDAARNYQTVLLQLEQDEVLWARLRVIRTFKEQVAACMKAIELGRPTPEDYPDLPNEAPEAWLMLAEAFRSPAAKSSLLFSRAASDTCPLHHISLPKQEVYRLRTVGLAMTKNCCRRVLISREH